MIRKQEKQINFSKSHEVLNQSFMSSINSREFSFEVEDLLFFFLPPMTPLLVGGFNPSEKY